MLLVSYFSSFAISLIFLSFAKPPPPPPPPPLPDKEDIVVLMVNTKQNAELTAKEEKRDASGDANRNGRSENGSVPSTGKHYQFSNLSRFVPFKKKKKKKRESEKEKRFYKMTQEYILVERK